MSRNSDDRELALWTQATLAPLRRQSADVDVAGLVMKRITASRPRPVTSILPVRWHRPAWAMTLVLGFASVVLLISTAAAMVANGDEGARATLTLAATAGTLLMHGLAAAGGVLKGLFEAALAMGRGGWTLVDAASPLVRMAGVVAAFGGAMSVGFSAIVVSRAQRHAPVVARGSWTGGSWLSHGGFS
ncbi:MAG TPA: hypothetical protein VFQ07_04815 [Candidatus Polarisedimenticolia bacterium]|nr:hypothetical protein [Candidatus Polarisedimenticolia bacterium]